jgi:hypothetical protein
MYGRTEVLRYEYASTEVLRYKACATRTSNRFLERHCRDRQVAIRLGKPPFELRGHC